MDRFGGAGGIPVPAGYHWCVSAVVSRPVTTTTNRGTPRRSRVVRPPAR